MEHLNLPIISDSTVLDLDKGTFQSNVQFVY